jgi:hypothetical protein
MGKNCRVGTSALKGGPRRSADTSLAFLGQEFSDQGVRDLLDEWIVPALVDQYLAEKNVLPDSTEEGHN